MSDFLLHLDAREKGLLAALLAHKTGIDDATGKGASTERIVAEQLIEPYLPPQFKCAKGAVVSSNDFALQSPAIDRVIYDSAAASPLLANPDHSIFPIEAVAGLVEVTMHLDRTKLRGDIERMVPIKQMRERYFVTPAWNSKSKSFSQKVDALSVRSFVVGLPASNTWSAHDIAATLRAIQRDLGPPTHVHALYVLGIGCFQTIAIDNDGEEPYRIQFWEGPQALFRFTTAIRTALDRWPARGPGSSAHLDRYLGGAPSQLSDAGYHQF